MLTAYRDSLARHRYRATKTTFVIAAMLFALSGALGLGYQLVWIRKATLLVGSSQIAYAATVSSFFLGLALGSAFVGRYLRSRERSPLFVYGIFEAAIGVFALAFPLLFGAAESAYNTLYPTLQSEVAVLFAGRFLLLLLLFLVPTFFMGGTLPLLLDGLVARDSAIGSSTSFLYGINIVGAVGGVLATSYFAIPYLGMNGTSQVAGVGNLTIGAVALVMFKDVKPVHLPGGPVVRGGGLFAVASFVSGFAAIAYQIEWVRYFDLVTVAQVYRTAMILGVYLSGLAVGSLMLGAILRAGVHPLRVVAWSQPVVPCLLLACLGLWSLPQLSHGAEVTAGSFEVVPSWSLVSERVDAIFLAPLAQVGVVILAPVVLIGTGLPAIIIAATKRSAELRRTSGRLVFWNTLGSSAGGFAAGYVLIPTLGLKDALVVTGLLSVSLALWAEWEARREEPKGLRAFRLALPVVSTGVLLAFSRSDLVPSTVWKQWADRTSEDRIVEIVEGPLATSYVLDGPEARVIGSNHVHLGVVPYRFPSTQAVQGHLPALFFGRSGYPERVLGIALGTGQTFGALLLYPVRRLDVVDISPGLVDLSLRHFAEFNHGLGSDERVKLHLDDGRHFVERAPSDYYDVVTLEPPPPTHEGVYALYSFEFYENVERVLRDGGVVSQWLPLYLLTPSEVRGILKTQAAVFPHTFLMTSGLGDFIVLSVKGASPPQYPLEWIRERAAVFERERNVRGFRAPNGGYTLPSLEGVLSLVVAGPDDIGRLDASPYRDDNMGLSYPQADAVIRRRHKPALGQVTLATLPRTPFRELQRFFTDSIPTAALDENRASFISAWSPVPSPGAIAKAEAQFRESDDPGERRDLAIRIALTHDQALEKDAALGWIRTAIDADPTAASQAAIASVRRIARHGIDVHAPALRRWIESLPALARRSSLANAVIEELDGHDDWERRYRSYLFPSLRTMLCRILVTPDTTRYGPTAPTSGACDWYFEG